MQQSQLPSFAEEPNYAIKRLGFDDDGDASPGYVRRQRESGESLIRRLRQDIDDVLQSQFPELARSVLGAKLLAVGFLQLREADFTHPALVVVLFHLCVVGLLQRGLFSVFDQRSR